jgi:hypothetical protein
MGNQELPGQQAAGFTINGHEKSAFRCRKALEQIRGFDPGWGLLGVIHFALDRGGRFNFLKLRERAKLGRLGFTGAAAGGRDEGSDGCAESKKDACHGFKRIV